MMACELVSLVLIILLTETSASPSASGTQQASSCPPLWHQIGQRCFAFYPVWSSWSAANPMCSQTGGKLASLHTQEELQSVRQLASNHTHVWLGGYLAQQKDSWRWSDDSPFNISSWTDWTKGQTREGDACMQMDPKSGELHSAPCGELRFYICSTSAGFFPGDKKPVEPGIFLNASLFDVVWSSSDTLADVILDSSSFLRELKSGHLTQRCYTNFMQQEALYLHRVSGMLEALVGRLQEADDITSLLLDALKHYSSRNPSQLTSPPPKWLQYSLQSFHSVVLEEPIYLLVALSARASLRNYLTERQFIPEISTCTLPVSGSGVKADCLFQEWRDESLREVAWTQRYRKVMELHKDQMDVYKAIDIFRVHMMNQKSFYRAVDCDAEDVL